MVDKCQFTGELASRTNDSSGKQLTYMTRVFYNSNYDKHMLKSLLSQSRPKLSPSKLMVRYRQWARVSNSNSNSTFIALNLCQSDRL